MSSPLHSAEKLEVRSFRVVFRLERRLHRFDRWRLPLPYGLPLRGTGYAVALLVVVMLAGRLPVVGELIGLVPAPLRYALIPGTVGFLLGRIEPDGRPAHGFLLAWLRHRRRPRELSAFRPVEPVGQELRIAEPIAFLPDAWGPGRRPARIVGPARVRVAYPLRGRQRRRRLELRQASEQPLRRPKIVTVPAGHEVVVR